jgi:predicted TIM-barrel fold metal-dependent hydrolase
MANISRIIAASMLCLLTSAPSLADDKKIAEPTGDLPIFDAHIHYKEPAWGPYPPQSVIELMDRNGVAMGLVSSTPDDGTIRLFEFAPNRIVPELRPYHGNAGSSNWTKATGMEEYLQQRLETYPHEGIGEFHIRRIDPADESLLRQIAAMAKDRNIPVHVHSDAPPIALLYRLEPDLTVIWAHAGMSEPANRVEQMMEKYPTLFADTSFREFDILETGTRLDPDWKRILIRFQDRFMVGTDTWVNSQWDRYSELIDVNRQWLALLPRGVAERIAYKNAETLFNRKVSLEQIGTR